MKKFQFLLLDAGPIIKLFELDLWDEFITRCDVTICRTVAEEAKWFVDPVEDARHDVDLEVYERQGAIHIKDINTSLVGAFFDKFNLTYKAQLDPGENETLAFMDTSGEPWCMCSSDAAVFRVLGLLGRANSGVSLEEVLRRIGLERSLDWKYSKRFRENYTRLGQTDAIQGQGLR
ncbi:MAG: hypothetical protein JW993_06455 [Sedimentisphaerales bacterium]|nr:hypothetical protein [Sedimentisphaerales bacterium]